MAAEPTSAGSIGITVFLVAVLGPLGGEYASILFAALAGAMWPLLSASNTTKVGGALLLLKIVLTAFTLTSAATFWLEEHYSFPARYGMNVVAFAIGALGNGWGPVFDGLRDALIALLGRFGQGPRDTGGQ